MKSLAVRRSAHLETDAGIGCAALEIGFSLLVQTHVWSDGVILAHSVGGGEILRRFRLHVDDEVVRVRQLNRRREIVTKKSEVLNPCAILKGLQI